MGLQRTSGSGNKTCYELDLEALNRKWAALNVRFAATHYPGWGYVVYVYNIVSRLDTHPGAFPTIRSKTVKGVHQAVALRMRKLCAYEEV